VRVLVTRPEPDAQRTAAALRARGHTTFIAPLIRIEAVADARIGAGPWAAILITSANAAHAMATPERRAALCDVPVLAVGERSAQAMGAAAFTNVISAAGGVDDLARLVAGQIKPEGSLPLLYLAGEQRSGDLAGTLRAQGFIVHTVVVYRAIAAATLPQSAIGALAEGVDGVLHFSRRSAETYLKAAQASDMLAIALKPAHLCLSAQAAEPLQRAGAAVIRIAMRPAEAALIELISPESG
jgi:uroporphyrinogen-III synthase